MHYQCFSAIFHLRRKFNAGRKRLFYGSQSCDRMYRFCGGRLPPFPIWVILGKDLSSLRQPFRSGSVSIKTDRLEFIDSWGYDFYAQQCKRSIDRPKLRGLNKHHSAFMKKCCTLAAISTKILSLEIHNKRIDRCVHQSFDKLFCECLEFGGDRRWGGRSEDAIYLIPR